MVLMRATEMTVNAFVWHRKIDSVITLENYFCAVQNITEGLQIELLFFLFG